MSTGNFLTNHRLINLGEEVRFSIRACPEAEFRIFPRYLENCDQEKARRREGKLEWLDELPSEPLDLKFVDSKAEVSYCPPESGNYMARLRTPEQTVYCYFAAVTPEYLVYRMEAYAIDYEIFASAPEMRNGGIPIDWALNVDQLDPMLDPAKGNLARLLEYQETFNDLMLPWYDYRDDRPREPYDMRPLLGAPPSRAPAHDSRKQRFIQQGRQEILVPDPSIEVAIRHNEQLWEIEYRITRGAPFPDFRIAVWDIPREFAGCPFETNATEFIPVRNVDNDYHGILVFDLAPEMTLELSFKKP